MNLDNGTENYFKTSTLTASDWMTASGVQSNWAVLKNFLNIYVTHIGGFLRQFYAIERKYWQCNVKISFLLQDSRKRKKNDNCALWGFRRAKVWLLLRTEKTKTLNIIKVASWSLYIPCVPGGIVGGKLRIRGKHYLLTDWDEDSGYFYLNQVGVILRIQSSLCGFFHLLFWITR